MTVSVVGDGLSAKNTLENCRRIHLETEVKIKRKNAFIFLPTSLGSRKVALLTVACYVALTSEQHSWLDYATKDAFC